MRHPRGNYTVGRTRDVSRHLDYTFRVDEPRSSLHVDPIDAHPLPPDYPAERRSQLLEALIARLRAVPGVTHAAYRNNAARRTRSSRPASSTINVPAADGAKASRRLPTRLTPGWRGRTTTASTASSSAPNDRTSWRSTVRTRSGQDGQQGSACGSREESESSSAAARASGGGAPRAVKNDGQDGGEPCPKDS